jgi:hypothetical protein
VGEEFPLPPLVPPPPPPLPPPMDHHHQEEDQQQRQERIEFLERLQESLQGQHHLEGCRNVDGREGMGDGSGKDWKQEKNQFEL